ncbi:hypothetical protein YTPLAS18_21560 [Nitrospira sp.]|nr:hypothetical protein YTPLAS18_21560 [Nitrospira sp.]
MGAPIGHPDDLTIRARRTLRRVNVIASKDPQATQALLAYHRITADVTSYHWGNRDQKTAVLLDHLHAGWAVALMSDTGTPGVYDTGTFLVHAVLKAGLPVIPIPGPSAVTAALSVSGLDGDRFVFAGCLPRGRSARAAWLSNVAMFDCTLVVLTDRRALAVTLRSLQATLGNRPVMIARQLTGPGERLERTSLAAALAKSSLRGLPEKITLVVQGPAPKRGRGQTRAAVTQNASSRRRIKTR